MAFIKGQMLRTTQLMLKRERGKMFKREEGLDLEKVLHEVEILILHLLIVYGGHL